MRYKKRYILAYVDAPSSYDYERKMLKTIRDAYAETFGSKGLDEARISLIGDGKRSRRHVSVDGRDEKNEAKIATEGADKTDLSRECINAHRMMLPIIIRCNIEHYSNVMRILAILGIRTVTTSGTLKALRRRQGLLVEEREKMDGDEVRAAPG